MAALYSSRVDFQVLGPLRALDGNVEVELGGPKQRLVLAILLAARGSTVSTDALIEGVWTDSPPASARKTLQGYIHHLRSRISGGLETEKSGYSLVAHDAHVDERCFMKSLEEAHPLLSADPRAASDQLASALGLWKGSPYADLDGAPVLLPEITRLSEARIVALGDRIDADLALGRHEMLIGELESLVTDYPFHERFRSQHMLALYRSGRQGEALRAYTRTRRQFVDEMGIDPAENLQELERRILDRDPSLDIDVTSTGSTHAVRGYELREVVGRDRRGTLYRGYQRSVGREVAIRVAGAEVADDPDFIARYEGDVARIAQLDHPRIAYVHDTWREPGRAYQVTRWLNGDRLEAYLSRERPSHDEALHILGQVAETLEFAHRGGVVHGDLDAHTLLRSENGEVFLTDFVVGAPPGTPDDDRAAFVRLSFHVLFGVPVPADEDACAVLRSVVTSTATAEVLREAFSDPASQAPTSLVHSFRRAFGLDVVQPAAPAPHSARTDARCPYKGLRAFGVADGPDFHGRDDLVGRMHRALVRRRLVAVVGPSGCGKSSAVRAGLVPRLRESRPAAVIVEMYPGSAPFEALTRAIRSVSVVDTVTTEELLADEYGLGRTLDRALPERVAEMVLVIDQFEEVFTSLADETARTLFLSSLVTALEDRASRLRVVLTMRADFFDRPLRYAEFGGLVERGLVPVAMPDHDGLRAAIERPAAAVGVGIEPGLTEAMLRDVEGEPGGLPLLEYALTELFERRDVDVLTLDEYHRSGGVRGALASRAESVFSGLDGAAQGVVKQAFLRMVAVDETGTHVRRRVNRSELRALEVDGPALEEGLRRFGAHRLLTFDADQVSRAPTVEVAHESLLAEWDRLRDWITDERDQLIIRRRLHAAVTEWESSGGDDAYLLTGRRLAEFDSWAGSTNVALSGEERAFLQSSREHAAVLERSASSRRRRAATALVVTAALALVFAVVAWVQRNEAADEASRSETARLASQAGFVMEDDRQLALLMAAEAYERDPGADGLSALLQVLVSSGNYLGNVGAGNAYRDARWLTPDRLIAVGEHDVHLIDTTTKSVTRLPIDPGPSADGVHAAIVATSPGGFAGLATANGQVLLVDAENATVAPLPAANGSSALAISPDGSTLALGRDDGAVELIDRESGQVVASVAAHPVRDRSAVDLPSGTTWDATTGTEVGGIDGVQFTADGFLLTSGGAFIRLWTVDGLDPVGPEIVHSEGDDEFNLVARPPRTMWTRHDDPEVVVVAGDRHVSQWDAVTGDRVALDVLPAPVVAVAARSDVALMLLPDARLVAHELDDLPGRTESFAVGSTFTFDVQEDGASTVDVAPGGSVAAVASSDGAVLVSLDGSALLADAVPIGASTSPSQSHDGSILAPGRATDGLVELTIDPPRGRAFDVGAEVTNIGAATFEIVRAGPGDAVIWTHDFARRRNAYDLETEEFLGDVWGDFVPAWSSDGERMAHARRTGGTRVVSAEDASDTYESMSTMRTADFDSSGERIVFAFEDGSATVVGLRNGSEVTLPETPGGIQSAAFTPDDSIVTVGADGSVVEIDPSVGRAVRELDDAGNAAGERAVPPRFSPDGTLMYSATDGAARIWHVPSGRRLGTLPSDSGEVPSATEDDDRLRVVTPVAGRALIWDLEADGWIEVACAAAGRDMTATEWAAHGPRDADHRSTCANTEEAS